MRLRCLDGGGDVELMMTTPTPDHGGIERFDFEVVCYPHCYGGTPKPVPCEYGEGEYVRYSDHAADRAAALAAKDAEIEKIRASKDRWLGRCGEALAAKDEAERERDEAVKLLRRMHTGICPKLVPNLKEGARIYWWEQMNDFLSRLAAKREGGE